MPRSTLGLAARAWDPNPFILLNLFLSMLAAIHAPVIMTMMMMMMSQNRQDKKTGCEANSTTK
jgi:CRP/FNR family transcriptional regulator, cyclic AMP receptor protein